MIELDFKNEDQAAEFEQWLIDGGFESFIDNSSFEDGEAQLTSPRYPGGITLTGAD